jgi:hypothetical protein
MTDSDDVKKRLKSKFHSKYLSLPLADDGD